VDQRSVGLVKHLKVMVRFGVMVSASAVRR